MDAYEVKVNKVSGKGKTSLSIPDLFFIFQWLEFTSFPKNNGKNIEVFASIRNVNPVWS